MDGLRPDSFREDLGIGEEKQAKKHLTALIQGERGLGRRIKELKKVQRKEI